MTVTAEQSRRAISKLLAVVAGPAYDQGDEIQPLHVQLERCIERVKAEASEGVALIDACAPHGRAMLSQAQQKLESLEELSHLHQLAVEQFGHNNVNTHA